MKNLLKQTWAQVKAQPLMSSVSVIGTALAIFLIMVVIMLQQVKMAPFAPESGRDRFLHYRYLSLHNDAWGPQDTSNGPMGTKTIKAVFDNLETPQAVAVYSWMAEPVPVSLPGTSATNADMLGTNIGFWKVFDFEFVTGEPYSQEQFDAGAPVVVLSESVARQLFGNTDVIGCDILIEHVVYRVCGVVRDVSTLANSSYAQMWVPYTSKSPTLGGYNDEIQGDLKVTMLAKDKSDFPAIRKELSARFADFEQSHPGWSIIHRNRPYDQLTSTAGEWANLEPDVAADRNRRFIILAILLIVPAINLSSMTHSRLGQRKSEIGVRRAFGCSRSQILLQIVMENFFITLIAGVIGLSLTVIFSYIFNENLYATAYSQITSEPMIHFGMLIQVSTLMWTLGFCFILNLISSGLPAWMASRTNVVNALRGN